MLIETHRFMATVVRHTCGLLLDLREVLGHLSCRECAHHLVIAFAHCGSFPHVYPDYEYTCESDIPHVIPQSPQMRAFFLPTRLLILLPPCEPGRVARVGLSSCSTRTAINR